MYKIEIAGHGGYAINIMGDFSTLKYTGKEYIKVYQAQLANGELSTSKRHFCSECVSFAINYNCLSLIIYWL